MDRVLDGIHAYTPGTGVWVTEYGHRTFDTQAEANAFEPDKNTAAKYMVRGLMEFFNRGVEKVFIYTLIDDIDTSGHRYGLIAKTAALDFVKRPAYYSVQRLIALFADPGAPFTPTALPYSLTGNLSDIHHHMFQRSDGKYLLAIWNDAETWSRSMIAPQIIPARTITLALGQNRRFIRRHLPTTTATVSTPFPRRRAKPRDRRLRPSRSGADAVLTCPS